MEDNAPLPEHNRQTIEWLKGFKHTGDLQRLVETHTFTPEELEFLRAHWELRPKKEHSKGNAAKWG